MSFFLAAKVGHSHHHRQKLVVKNWGQKRSPSPFFDVGGSDSAIFLCFIKLPDNNPLLTGSRQQWFIAVLRPGYLTDFAWKTLHQPGGGLFQWSMDIVRSRLPEAKYLPWYDQAQSRLAPGTSNK